MALRLEYCRDSRRIRCDICAVSTPISNSIAAGTFVHSSICRTSQSSYQITGNKVHEQQPQRLYIENGIVKCDHCVAGFGTAWYESNDGGVFSHLGGCNYVHERIKLTHGIIEYLSVTQQSRTTCLECKNQFVQTLDHGVCGTCTEMIKNYLFDKHYYGPGTWRAENRKVEDSSLKMGTLAECDLYSKYLPDQCPSCNTQLEVSPTGRLLCPSRACAKNRNFAVRYGANTEQVHAALGLHAHVRTTTYKAQQYFIDSIVKLRSSPRCQCGSDACGSPSHSDWCPKYEKLSAAR